MSLFIDKFIHFNNKIISITVVSFLFILTGILFVITQTKIEKTVKLTGTIEPQKHVRLFSDVSAKSIFINQFENNRAKKGDLILILDTLQVHRSFIQLNQQRKQLDLEIESTEIAFENQQRQRLFELKILENQIQKQQEQLERTQKEYRENPEFYLIQEQKRELKSLKLNLYKVQKDYEHTALHKNQIRVLKQKQLQIKEELNQLRIDYKKHFVYAPFDCEILSKLDQKSIGTFYRQGEEIAKISESNMLWHVNFWANQTNTKLIQEGQKITLYFDAYPFMKYGTWEGNVDKVQYFDTSRNAFLIRGSFKNNNVLIKEGFSVTGKVLIKEDYIYNIFFDDLSQQIKPVI